MRCSTIATKHLKQSTYNIGNVFIHVHVHVRLQSLSFTGCTFPNSSNFFSKFKRGSSVWSQSQWRFSFHFYKSIALKSNWLFRFIIPLLLPMKKMRKRVKQSLIPEKMALLRAVQTSSFITTLDSFLFQTFSIEKLMTFQWYLRVHRHHHQ